MNARTVFISYSHDSDAHRERVLELSERLRDDGIETQLDQYINGTPIEGWPRWMLNRLDEADFVVVVCTETYYLRFRGHEVPGKGKGVGWEGALITQEIYDARSNTLKFVPVLFVAGDETFIPEPLRPLSRYLVNSDPNYGALYDFLLGQSGVEPRPVGTPRSKRRRRGVPLRFDETGGSSESHASIAATGLSVARNKFTGREKSPSRRSDVDPAFEQVAITNSASENPTVVGIEFVADGPLSEFDQARWEAALRELLDQDISKIRIVSIRRGSTVVRVLGDPEVIAKALEKLRTSSETSRDFQISTGFRSYSGVLTNKAAAQIFGRSEELSRLDLAWNDHKIHVLSIIGFGGVGKSYLIAHWMARLAADGWRGAERVFDWSFYSQGTREQGAFSADAFVAAALKFFGDEAMAQTAASPWEKGARLAQLIAQQRTLIVLDGLEPLQHPPGSFAGELKDPALAALLRGLAQHNPGLCIVTTRERVADLGPFQDTTAAEWELQHLSTSAGVELLKTLGVHGPEVEFQQLIEDVNGHALTLNLLGRYLAKAHHGDIRRRDRIKFDRADSRIKGGHAFKTLAAYEEWLATRGEDGARQLAILRLLGLFDRPTDLGLLALMSREPVIPDLTEPLIGLSGDDWNLALSSLADASLVLFKSNQSEVDAHPLIREHFAKQLRERNPKAWRAAHQRLYEHLKDSAEDQPDTLEGLEPLYQAVAHGCQAGLTQDAFDEIYMPRILRGGEFHSWRKFGVFGSDLGTTAWFFERPWIRLVPKLSGPAKAFLLNYAAFCLRALGRLTEALEPMRAGLEIHTKQEVWISAAITASNLSELELSLGDLTAAVRDATESVAHADRSGDEFQRMGTRTTLADALHQAGLRADAESYFRNAEQMQAERQPKYPLLYSLEGFQYCDVLLAEPERAAWQITLKNEESLSSETIDRSAVRETSSSVAQRARTMFEWRQPTDSLLDVALDHLTLGRAGLYASIIDPASIGNRQLATENLNVAVDVLRRAGTMDHFPRPLLSRAWLQHQENDADGAHSDLDEAWEIAERGPMRLHMADIHLYRARLFHGVKLYPWKSAQEDLAAARKLIEQCGYWRRKEELEDAEAAAKNW